MGCSTRRMSLKRAGGLRKFSINNQTSGIYAATIGAGYGLNVNVAYGYDTVRLGSAENDLPSIPDQLIGGLTTNDFYMGMFGLSSLLTMLEGLAAPVETGSMYGLPESKGYGSLILGGHDTSLYTQNDLIFNLNSRQQRPGFEDTYQASIDSSVPYIYLPVDVCKQFESAFGLVWDEASQLYLVDDNLRTHIVLPYKAFDLYATSPLVQTSSHYFPLKRAANPGQVTLGRAFLQEAYLIVDYERASFSLHQRVWPTGAPVPAKVVAIPPLAPGTTENKTQKAAPPNITAIVGGVGGGLILVLVIAGAVVFALKRQKRINAENAANSEARGPPGAPGDMEEIDISGPSNFSNHPDEMIQPYHVTHRSLSPHDDGLSPNDDESIYGNDERLIPCHPDLSHQPQSTNKIYRKDRQ
ncbi:hypothetical protein M7I_7391 [Glarea lozoyensis 74030]|uniref:Acid protease n=1 Tax=Glarea lozoyensis (strain ATCC 74030 / MF5533) TaxID=1104152 RepID=H0EX64_GLAL7|nr:hypothetical protein M7I_7391 [Glarea lozoyensis 74030]